MNIEIAQSARKHGISDEDILYAIEHFDERVILDELPDKVVYIGYDKSLRNLEAITIEFIDGVETVIHAMKLRKSTLALIRAIKDESN